MVVRVAGKRVPDAAIAGSNYAAWVVLSAAVAFVLLRALTMRQRLTPFPLARSSARAARSPPSSSRSTSS